MTEFNINDKVRVKLTDHGRKLLESDHEEFWKNMRIPMVYTPPVEDSEGWSTWQLWNLMQQLGPYIHLSCQVPFETTIEFEPINQGVTCKQQSKALSIPKITLRFLSTIRQYGTVLKLSSLKIWDSILKGK